MSTHQIRSDIDLAHAELVRRLAAIRPNRIVGGFADPADLEARADYLLALAAAIDLFILACGEDAAGKVSGNFDLRDFTDVLRGALEGDACAQLNQRADLVLEELHDGDLSRRVVGRR